MLSLIRIAGIPLEVWLTLPFTVISLYIVFRWRGFGEDAFTWNHQYFKRACSAGFIVATLSYVASFFPAAMHIGLLWLVAFIAAIAVLSYSFSEELLNATILSLFIVLVGVLSMPIPGFIRRAIFGVTTTPSKQAFSPTTDLRHFVLHLPDGWSEIPNQKPRTYRRKDKGSGYFKLSLLPPSEDKITTGEQAEQKLESNLQEIGKNLDLGKRLRLTHENCVCGIMAYADYQSEQHGPMRFWLIFTEVTVFASYTDGQNVAIAEKEIAEAHQALSSANFQGSSYAAYDVIIR